ncbi:MAG TPA: hypothetical protein VHN59_10740 [Chitinophagaceae bacterium]|nr:hypothetical protein [Chitinophagaceae bacterium]
MALTYWFIFKTEVLIDKFGLDKGFAEPSFQFKIDVSSILQMALIITATIILVWEIPSLGKNIFYVWQQSRMGFLNPEGANWSPIIISVIRIILALLLIGERKRILSLLENKRGEMNSSVDPNEPE